MPTPAALLLTTALGTIQRRLGVPSEPTAATVEMLKRTGTYSIEKSRTELGVEPLVSFEAELAKREAVASGEYAAKTEIGWGHQIRSYVLQPYQLVKDLRTGVESRTPSDVLDGDLDPFMAAALAQEVGGKPREKIEDIE